MAEKREGVFLDEVYLSPVARVMSDPELSPVSKALAGIVDEPEPVVESGPSYRDLKKRLEGTALPVDPDELARIRQYKADRRAAEQAAQAAAREQDAKDKALRRLPHQSHVMAVIDALEASLGVTDEQTRLECYATARQHMVYAEQQIQQNIRQTAREAAVAAAEEATHGAEV